MAVELILNLMFLSPGEDSRIKLLRLVLPVFRATVFDPLTWVILLNAKISIEPVLIVVTIFYKKRNESCFLLIVSDTSTTARGIEYSSFSPLETSVREVKSSSLFPVIFITLTG